MPVTNVKADWSAGDLRFTDSSGTQLAAVTTSGLELAADGTAITATAAELNTLDGVTASVTELNHLTNADKLEKIIKVALTASDAAAGLFSWQNTEESAAIIVTRVILDVTTAATGACTANVGQAATSTGADNLIDGVDIGTAAGLFDNLGDAGTNGKKQQKVADDEFVTGSVATGASAGLVGSAYIHYYVA